MILKILYSTYFKLLLSLSLFVYFCGVTHPLLAEENTVFELQKSIIFDHWVNNGDQFFTHHNKIYIVIWAKDEEVLGGITSFLLSCEIGKNNWTAQPIKGKAYFLGEKYNNQICAILPDSSSDNIWMMSFYDIALNFDKELSYSFLREKHETDRFCPVPVAYDQKTVLLYSVYRHEKRSVVTGFLLSLISGGHGWKPAIGYTLGVLASTELLLSDDQLTYGHVIDRSSKRNIFPVYKQGVIEPLSSSIKETEGRKVKWYELISADVSFSMNREGRLLVDGNVLKRFDLDMKLIENIILPPQLNSSAIGKYVGMTTDNDGNVFFVKKSTVGSSISVWSYSRALQSWEEYSVAHDNLGLRKLSLFKNDSFLYIALWSYPEKFEIILVNGE